MDKYKKFGIHLMTYHSERSGTFFLTDDTGFIQYRMEGSICYVDEMFIVKQLRGTGEATKLANRLSILVRNQGCDKLVAYVNSELESADTNRRVLKAYGFNIDYDFDCGVDSQIPYRKNL